MNKYYSQRAYKEPVIDLKGNQCPDLIIVIPCYNEPFSNVKQCIESLINQEEDPVQTLVLLLINYKSSDSEEIKMASQSLKNSIDQYVVKLNQAFMRFHTFLEAFSGKTAGVGKARKILMDMAFNLFYDNAKNGIIVNLDADTMVHKNYLCKINRFFKTHNEIEAASIAFYHPIADREKDAESFHAGLYETHLRYFINMQRLINLPYAFQTIGSAMAVRAWAYAKEGGMNQRQAGEDFYFLHKFISKGTLAEINDTWVVPSSRRSSRVPFGTGKAISDAMLSRESERKSYNPDSFIILQNWILQIKNASIINTTIIRSPDNALNLFLQQIQAECKLKEIEANTKGKDSFMKRFYQWFDAFLLMKYLHFMREHGYQDQPLSKCLEYLFDRLNLKINSDPLKNLTELRHIDQKASYDRN